MIAMMKIVHYQVALAEDVMSKLKEKTGQRTATGALTTAVERTLSACGGDEQ